MKRIYAYGRSKDDKFDIPTYHEGPWWAIIGETLCWKMINFMFDTNEWFEKFTHEYEGKRIRKSE